MTPLMTGATLGLVAAIGILTVVRYAPPARRPGLQERVAPFLRETPRPSALLGAGDRQLSLPGAIGRIFAPRARLISRTVDQWIGGSGSVHRRLDALDNGGTVDDFRFEQVIWASIGLVIGAGAGVVVSLLSFKFTIASVLLFAVAGLVGGLFGRDYWLSQQVQRRQASILAEFPVVADLLALAVTAGEGPIGAIDRVSRLVDGELGRSLQAALARSRAGMTLTDALERLATTSGIEPLSRFIDGVVIAIERGTPLAEVLRAQAVDVREAQKRRLLETGGRKELAMMVPVVFLVLPVTVVFALFPGLFAIVELSQ
ncbi:MAG: type II secretion system F family protein [Antricoccus sp.]